MNGEHVPPDGEQYLAEFLLRHATDRQRRRDGHDLYEGGKKIGGKKMTAKRNLFVGPRVCLLDAEQVPERPQERLAAGKRERRVGRLADFILAQYLRHAGRAIAI